MFADPRTARAAQRHSVRVLQHERRRAVGAKNNEAVRLQEAGEGRVARRNQHVGQLAALDGAAQRGGHHECQLRLHAVAEVVEHDTAALRRQRGVDALALPAAQHAVRLQQVWSGVESHEAKRRERVGRRAQALKKSIPRRDERQWQMQTNNSRQMTTERTGVRDNRVVRRMLKHLVVRQQ